MQQRFNPHDWLPNDKGNDIELIVSRIEASHTDITGSYTDWLNLGFALADELGERGRDYFHRISRFYSKYSYTDCNNQFDQCLKAKGHGITIKTLFHLAKMAGIEIGGMGLGAGGWGHGASSSKFQVPGSTPTGSMPQAAGSEPEVVDLSTLPDSVFEALPEFFKKVVARCLTNEQRDIMLLGSLATVSACLPKVFGFYDEARVFPNLFLYITAQASAGKGRLTFCKRLVYPVHWELRKQSQAMKAQYEIEMREYNLMKMKDFSASKPVKPPEKMLFIPANNSTTGVFQLLSDNDGNGLIFETEGDTLAQAFKSDYGNYSDGFRKVFHHESISYYRRTDREFVEIDNPYLSTVLSSTPKQVAILIPNAENGLLSRFIFYQMNIKPVWKNVFPPRQGKNLDVYFDELGQEFFSFYKALGEHPSIEFFLTEEQKNQFHAFFTQVQDKYLILQGMDYMATIRRLGLIAFRIAMILTTLRILETGDFSPIQVCSETDFQTVLSMIRVLMKHSSHVYSELPEEVKTAKQKNKKEQFLDKLPERFSYNDFIGLARSISIPSRTAEKYISIFCQKGLIQREKPGEYTNLSLGERKDQTGEKPEGEK